MHLVGEIDAATAPKLRRCLDHDARIRVLDMAQVTFMDSSGLKVLVIANHSREGCALTGRVRARSCCSLPEAAQDPRLRADPPQQA